MKERVKKFIEGLGAISLVVALLFLFFLILFSLTSIIYVSLKLHDYSGLLGWGCVAVMIIELLMVIPRSEEQLYDKKTNQEKSLNKKIDIIEAFWNMQVKKNTFSLIGISIFFVAYFVVNIKLKRNIEHTIPIIFTALGGLIVIKQSLTAYRIKNQYFGTNYEEVKEIVYFILESNNDDLNNGKFIFDEDKNEIQINNEQAEYS